MFVAFVVLVVLLVLLGVWVMVTYNRLIKLRNSWQEAWAGIDVQLTRRADLVPNLVATVQGYAGHEREVLTEVTDARSRLAAAREPGEAGRADDMLEAALGRLFAVAEDYPELRADEQYLNLQRELARLEEDLAFARRFHNAVAERYNTAQQTFPNLLIARPLGFEPVSYFKADAEDRAVPTVSP